MNEDKIIKMLIEEEDPSTAPATVSEEDQEFLELMNGRSAAHRKQTEDRIAMAREEEIRRAVAKKATARRLASRSLLIRAVGVAALLLILWVVQICGLVAWQLALAIGAIATMWLCLWAGAWIQFMWCKGGLLQ